MASISLGIFLDKISCPDCVIRMSRAIGDQAGISFATAFYQALGYGEDVATAFELGCSQIDLENLDEQDIPQLLGAGCRGIRFVPDPRKMSLDEKPG